MAILNAFFFHWLLFPLGNSSLRQRECLVSWSMCWEMYMTLIYYRFGKNLVNNLMRSAWGNRLNPKGWGKSTWQSISNPIKVFLVRNNIRDLDNLTLDACFSSMVNLWMSYYYRHSTVPVQFHCTPRTTMWGPHGCLHSKISWCQKYTQPCRKISDLEDRTFEIIQSEEQKEKKMNEKKCRKPMGLMEHNKKNSMRIPKREEIEMNRKYTQDRAKVSIQL